jgi:carbamoyltransferase
MDIAASIQAVTEEIMLRCARHVARQTGMRNRVMAGGVALNCVGNGRICREGDFEQVFIQPAAGDAGGALGAALFVWYQLLGNPRLADGVNDFQGGSLLGPAYSSGEIRDYLNSVGARYRRYADEAILLDIVADEIAAEKVVGHFCGRMEFGPRALGARSIIGDARSSKMQSLMNLKIKFRESFRPFAPCVLRENVHEWFEMPLTQESPYMLLVADVQLDKRVPVDESELGGLTGIDRLLKTVRSKIPAVTHVDYSARVQTVDAERHGRLYRLMKSIQGEDWLSGDHQYELQRPRRAHRVHPGRRVSVLHGLQHGRARSGGLCAVQGGTTQGDAA